MLKHRRSRSARPVEDEPAEDAAQLAGEHHPVPSLKLWSALAVVVAGCGFAGSKEPWALGSIAALIALNLAIAPPRWQVPQAITWPVMLFALLSLGSFLPLRETAVPWWRKTFEQDFGVSLGGLRSPQPWVSLEAWIVIAIGLIWLWHCLGRGFSESERRWLVRMLALLVTVIATLAVWFKRAGIDVPFWQRSEWDLNYFGPFPNRNNFGGLLAMGAVLTFAGAYDSFRLRSRWWPLYSLALAPILLALISNTSRAGIGLFFIGLVAWIAFASFSRRSAQRMGVAAAALLSLITVVILFGGHILERMNLTGSPDSLLGNSRLLVWTDAISMISKVPLLGVGLGCFAAVFPFHQRYFDVNARHIHPESDWLWIAAEAGLPAVILLVVALVNYTSRTGMWQSKPGHKGRGDRRMRNACAVAALILPVHSLVDTPAHQPGLACLAALLAGLSLRARRPAGAPTAPRSGKTRLLFAGFCCAASAAWFAIAAGVPVLPGTSSARMLEREAARLIRNGDLAAASSVINREIAMIPADWWVYFDRAELSLARGAPPNAALEDFARTRYLEPHGSRACVQEALTWLKYHPIYAPAAWREAMRRDTSRAYFFYDYYALNSLREHPELRSAVRSLASTPKQKLAYLRFCGPEEFTDALAELLEIDPSLEGFSPDERLQIFDGWYAVGDRKQLIARLEKDAVWRSDGWPVLAQDRAAQGDFSGAYQIALQYLPSPAESRASREGDLAKLRKDFLFHPTDFNYGFALFEAESRKDLIDDALVTLDKVSQIPDAPARVLYEQAVLLSRKGDHAAAWTKMKTYIERWQITRRNAPPATTAGEAKVKGDARNLLKKTPGE